MSDLTKNAKAALLLYIAAPKEKPPQAEILKLVKKGVDVSQTNDVGWNLLHYGAIHGHLDVCEALIQQNADVHARDRWGDTPLHFVAHLGHTEVIKFLLEQGTDIDVKDGDGKTPLYYAADSGKKESIELLLTQGANIWAQSVVNSRAPGAAIRLITSHLNEWVQVFNELKTGDYSNINTSQDLYHLASLMKPSNPKNVPPPKELIRILFQQYLPHDEKFNTMYAEIFSHPRPQEQDLQAAREAAKSRGVVL